MMVHLYLVVKKWLLFLVLMLLLFAFSGCAGEQKADAPLKVGMDASYAPFGFQNIDTKDYEGFDVDVIRAIAAEENFSVQVVNLNFDGLIPALQTGDLDIVINDMTITDERKKSVDFSGRYYIAGLGIVTRKDNGEIRGKADLSGRTIGVSIASTGEEAARKIPGAEVKSYNTITDAFLDLKNGGVEAVLNDYPVDLYYVAKQGPELQVLPHPITTEDLGIAVKKGNAELLAKINKGLSAIKKNGKYSEIYKKWFGEEPPAEILR